jgi:hypothetical protein
MRRNNQKNRRKPTTGLKKLTQLEQIQLKNEMRLTGPDDFSAQETRHMRVRFAATAGTASATFTVQQLVRMCGIIAVTATTTYVLSTLVKINRIRVWSPVATAGVPVTAAVQWPNNSSTEQIAGPPVVQSDSASGLSQYAHVDVKPPKGSWCDKWHQANDTTTWVFITYATGGFVDIDFKWFLDDLGATIAGPTVAGATVGAIYHWGVNNLTCQYVNAIS